MQHVTAHNLKFSLIQFSKREFLSHHTMNDLPLASLTALAYVCIEEYLSWEGNQARAYIWGILLGVVCGLGLMLKWSFVVYVGVPAAWIMWKWFRTKQWTVLGVFFCVLLPVAGPWYILNGIPSFLRILKLSSLKDSGNPRVWTWAGWFWYVKGIALKQILWPFVIPFAAGLWVCWHHRMWNLLIWVCVPLILFTLIQNKGLRYFVPSLPALDVVSCLSADLFVNKKGQLAWWFGWCFLIVFLGMLYGFGNRWPEALQKTNAGWRLSEIKAEKFSQIIIKCD
jgi:4-amino-4-deoxy-L-arabinose transferase-like glycosyltransferase